MPVLIKYVSRSKMHKRTIFLPFRHNTVIVIITVLLIAGFLFLHLEASDQFILHVNVKKTLLGHAWPDVVLNVFFPETRGFDFSYFTSYMSDSYSITKPQSLRKETLSSNLIILE